MGPRQSITAIANDFIIIIIIIYFITLFNCPWYSVPKGGEIKQIV